MQFNFSFFFCPKKCYFLFSTVKELLRNRRDLLAYSEPHRFTGSRFLGNQYAVIIEMDCECVIVGPGRS